MNHARPMNFRLRPLHFLLLAAAILLVHLAVASTADAEKRLKTAVGEVIAVADQAPTPSALAASLRPILQRHLSFETMTRRAVGPGWRQLSPAQQAKATDHFTTLIIRTYSGKFTPGERAVVELKPATTLAPGRFEVPTTLIYKGSRYVVTYRLEDAAGGRITDVLVEGVSLVANYRTQFDAQFKKGGAEGLITALTQAVAASP